MSRLYALLKSRFSSPRVNLAGSLLLRAPMRVAVPICRGRVSPVFDVSKRYRIVDVNSRGTFDQAEHMVCGEACRELVTLAVDLVICAGITRELRFRLRTHGINVLAGYCGPVDEVIHAYLVSRLDSGDFDMPGCTRKHRELCLAEMAPRQGTAEVAD